VRAVDDAAQGDGHAAHLAPVTAAEEEDARADDLHPLIFPKRQQASLTGHQVVGRGRSGSRQSQLNAPKAAR
jgi:hypothetical protein